MADVSGNTLLMAVQAVDDAIQILRVRIDAAAGDPRDDVQMLTAYIRTAEELRAAYEIARLSSTNLPSLGR